MSIRCTMDGMQLLTIWWAAIICISGNDEVSSCEVVITVRRGTTKRVTPGQSLTVKCPVKLCGKSFNVKWCKFTNTSSCEIISNMENKSIRQEYHGDDLISYLTFNWVSITDDGLYRCDLVHSHESVSHTINISVSDLNQGVENSDDDAVGSNIVDDDGPWLPYFMICISVVFLIITVIILTLVCFHGWKRTWIFNTKRQEQEISTHMIPELPKMSAPSSPILRTQFPVWNVINSSSKAERTTSTSPALTHIGNRPAVTNRAAKIQVSNNEMYAVINYQQGGTPARKYICTQDEKTQYAVIKVT